MWGGGEAPLLVGDAPLLMEGCITFSSLFDQKVSLFWSKLVNPRQNVTSFYAKNVIYHFYLPDSAEVLVKITVFDQKVSFFMKKW